MRGKVYVGLEDIQNITELLGKTESSEAQTFNPSIHNTEAGKSEFKASLV